MCISRGNTKSSFSYSPTQKSFEAPELNLTMEGGNRFFVTKPVEVFSVKVQLFTGFHHIYIYSSTVFCFHCFFLSLFLIRNDHLQGGGRIFCLGVLKSGDVNIIGRKYTLFCDY